MIDALLTFAQMMARMLESLAAFGLDNGTVG